MKNRETEILKLLAAARRQKDFFKIPDGWQNETMRRIRLSKAIHSETGDLAVFNRFVWRFAATACVLLLILSLYTFRADFQAEYEMAQLFMKDPLGFGMVQTFGIL